MKSDVIIREHLGEDGFPEVGVKECMKAASFGFILWIHKNCAKSFYDDQFFYLAKLRTMNDLYEIYDKEK